jgi:hypothetical protein
LKLLQAKLVLVQVSAKRTGGELGRAMKRKKLPKPVTNVPLPPLTEMRVYQAAVFDKMRLHLDDRGSYCLLVPIDNEAWEELWRYVGDTEVLKWMEATTREAIRKAPQPNMFSATLRPVGVLDGTDKAVVISLRIKLWANGTEEKIWRVWLATEEGIKELNQAFVSTIQKTAQAVDDSVEESGGGVN